MRHDFFEKLILKGGQILNMKIIKFLYLISNLSQKNLKIKTDVVLNKCIV